MRLKFEGLNRLGLMTEFLKEDVIWHRYSRQVIKLVEICTDFPQDVKEIFGIEVIETINNPIDLLLQKMLNNISIKLIACGSLLIEGEEVTTYKCEFPQDKRWDFFQKWDEDNQVDFNCFDKMMYGACKRRK